MSTKKQKKVKGSAAPVSEESKEKMKEQINARISNEVTKAKKFIHAIVTHRGFIKRADGEIARNDAEINTCRAQIKDADEIDKITLNTRIESCVVYGKFLKALYKTYKKNLVKLEKLFRVFSNKYGIVVQQGSLEDDSLRDFIEDKPIEGKPVKKTAKKPSRK